MNLIYEKNGYIYVHNETLDIELPEWVTTDYPGDPYFLLNETTRILFKNYFLPFLQSGHFKISKVLYDDIRNFKQNPVREPEVPIFHSIGDILLKPHQINAINNMLTHKRFAFFYGTGTGKTLIAISYLYAFVVDSIIISEGLSSDSNKHNVIIVTPKKVVPQYEAECRKYLSGFYDINTTGDCTKPFTITIINFESLHKVKCKWCDCLIIDESHKAKSYTSEINKHLRKLAQISDEIYLFTGTPIDKSRHEIFPQLAILDERVYPSKTRFNHRYYRLDDYHNPTSEKRYFKNEITSMIKSYSEAVATTDVVELPELVNVVVDCEHPDDYHDDLKKRNLTSVSVPHMKAKGICIADTPTIVRTKQQEVCSGFLMDIEFTERDVYGKAISTIKTNEYLHTKSYKMSKLKELITEGKFDKGIIFTCFTMEIALVQDVIWETGKSCVVINGDTPSSYINIYKEKLRKGEIDFIIANVQCTNAGLDMYFVNKVVFYSLPDSYITYHQCVSRIYRMGQTQKCYVYHLICKDSVETIKYKALSSKQNFTNKFYASYKEVRK